MGCGASTTRASETDSVNEKDHRQTSASSNSQSEVPPAAQGNSNGAGGATATSKAATASGTSAADTTNAQTASAQGSPSSPIDSCHDSRGAYVRGHNIPGNCLLPFAGLPLPDMIGGQPVNCIQDATGSKVYSTLSSRSKAENLVLWLDIVLKATAGDIDTSWMDPQLEATVPRPPGTTEADKAPIAPVVLPGRAPMVSPSATSFEVNDQGSPMIGVPPDLSLSVAAQGEASYQNMSRTTSTSNNRISLQNASSSSNPLMAEVPADREGDARGMPSRSVSNASKGDRGGAIRSPGKQ
jgi:hypothetical protein